MLWWMMVFSESQFFCLKKCMVRAVSTFSKNNIWGQMHTTLCRFTEKKTVCLSQRQTYACTIFSSDLESSTNAWFCFINLIHCGTGRMLTIISAPTVRLYFVVHTPSNSLLHMYTCARSTHLTIRNTAKSAISPHVLHRQSWSNGAKVYSQKDEQWCHS